MISSLQNLSRSVGCALLIAASGKTMMGIFISVEVCLFMLYKVIRGEFSWWPKMSGAVNIFGSFFARLVVKVICDFTGKIYLRDTSSDQIA